MSEATATIERTQVQPIVETDRSMRYLGVEVEKAKKRTNRVPDREKYKDIAHTKTALEMKRDIALGIRTHTPTFLEGGSGLGKTTIPKAMAAELGYEVYEMTCTPQTDRDAFYGTWVPNTNRERPEDSAYIFKPGPLTLALRPGEEWVKKMLIVNEPNAPIDGLKIFNEVFDALNDNGIIEIPSPDGSTSEKIQLDREALVLVFSANTPTDEYTDVSNVSKDFATRVNKIVLPEDLPPDDFTHAWLAKLGQAPPFQAVPPEAFLLSNEKAIADAELAALPGAVDILKLYTGFHNDLLQQIDDGTIEKSPHGQALGFGSYKQQERVWDFMKLFANKDNILQTMRAALRYYYASRMYGEDRQRVEKMIDALGTTETQAAPHTIGADWE